LDVADLTDPRGTVHQQLVGWATLTAEQRHLSSTPTDTHTAARLLVIHLDWAAAQPWIDDMAQEVHDAAHAVRRACHDLPEPPLGNCPDVDPDGQADRCGGPLRWSDHTAGVRCSRCGSTWSEQDLPHLLRVVQPTRRFPVPRAWVCINYQITPGQLRTWIWRKHIRTYADDQVDLVDVLQRLTDTPTTTE
jgi:hypothetical protein